MKKTVCKVLLGGIMLSLSSNKAFAHDIAVENG